ncbi:ComEC/Rec2 family competence protein [Microbacterium sp. LWH12-1.2]|uniref:ComEC/Rec2 family competence protein n=1 Tax=Microbacterium sp. LWH12-1.2 TaxID=3135259 RepID=UPI00341C4AEF
MKARELRLVPLAAAVWGAALLCVLLPQVAWGCAVVCGMLALTLLGLLTARQRGRTELVRGGLAVVLLASAAATAVAVGFAAPSRTEVAAHDGRVVEVFAEISSSASIGQDGRLWFDARTTRAGPPDSATPASASVRIGVDPGDGFDLGARIRVVGEAMATDAGERAALIVFVSEAEIISPASGVFGVAAQVRHDFIERSVRLPEPGAGLLPGLAVGDTRAVPTALNDDMRVSGLSHLTAVSGANCAIVVGAVFWLTAVCRGGRMLRVVLSLTALASFVVLVTPEPSVVRAAVMAGFAMLTVLLGRPSAGVGVLAVCVVGILLVDPWLAATPGFALSAAASGALIVLARPLAAGLGRWMPEPLALAIAVPLAAQLVCGPIIALFAEQQSLIGLAANLLAAPAAPLATVIGLLACLAAPVPALADLLAASAWLPAAWIASTATTTAQLPGAQVLVVPGLGSSLLVAVLSAALGLVIIRPVQAPAFLRRLRAGAFAVVVSTLSHAGAHLVLTGPLVTATTPDGWSIAACDVGQGDALLVRSDDEVALIDTGPEAAPLAACLSSLGIERIDLLVLTHFDLDHVGGVDAVRGRVETVLHGPIGEEADQRMLNDLSAAGATAVDAATGMRGELGTASWRVLWPRPDSAAFPAGNDASIVWEISGGDVPRAIFLGDLAATPQRMLVASGQIRGAYTVVKVAHHGSADQDPGLYEALGPVAALFSAGADNDYGHPRQETIDILDAVGAHILRTDEQGRILLGLRDGELEVWTERNAGEEGAVTGSSVGDPG